MQKITIWKKKVCSPCDGFPLLQRVVVVVVVLVLVVVFAEKSFSATGLCCKSGGSSNGTDLEQWWQRKRQSEWKADSMVVVVVFVLTHSHPHTHERKPEVAPLWSLSEKRWSGAGAGADKQVVARAHRS